MYRYRYLLYNFIIVKIFSRNKLIVHFERFAGALLRVSIKLSLALRKRQKN